MKTTVCLLYANCIPVKGAKNSVICDLQRNNYVQIPMDLYNIITQHKGKSIKEIKKYYENKYDEIIDNYFKILIDNDFAFMTDTPELFPELNMAWDQPMEVSNAIIDFDESSDFDWKNILDQLSDLHCKFVQFRFYNNIEISQIRKILNYMNLIQSNSIGVDFVLPFPEHSNLEDFLTLFAMYKRLNTVVLSNSPNGKHIQMVEPSKYLIQMSHAISSEKSCGVIDKNTFAIHLKTFTEAQKFNTCLNGKISVDKNGEIRNCPSMSQSFGNVNGTKLLKAVEDKRFKKYWNLNKDQINVCKDCEFRYICTDCRAYTQDASNDLSKPLKCGYNPYEGKWKPWSLNHLQYAELG